MIFDFILNLVEIHVLNLLLNFRQLILKISILNTQIHKNFQILKVL